MRTTAPVWAWCPPWGTSPFGGSDKGIRTNQGVPGNRFATAVAFWKSWEFIGASGNDSRVPAKPLVTERKKGLSNQSIVTVQTDKVATAQPLHRQGSVQRPRNRTVFCPPHL